MTKADAAFRTIGEVAAETGIRQNVLRYWEGLFPALRPVTRAGNRRYYRPDDVALVRRIQHLLDDEGYTVRGVQKLLASGTAPIVPAPAADEAAAPAAMAAIDPDRLRAFRDRLVAALADA